MKYTRSQTSSERRSSGPPSILPLAVRPKQVAVPRASAQFCRAAASRYSSAAALCAEECDGGDERDDALAQEIGTQNGEEQSSSSGAAAIRYAQIRRQPPVKLKQRTRPSLTREAAAGGQCERSATSAFAAKFCVCL